MKLLLALLAGLGLALYILLMADGPSLLDIINRF
jgi:small-conductance mechanosensitive channel